MLIFASYIIVGYTTRTKVTEKFGITNSAGCLCPVVKQGRRMLPMFY